MSRNISRRELFRVLGASGMAASLASTGSFISAADAAGMRVGTFRCDVTPPVGHRLYPKTLVTVEHPLYAKGIVLEDGGRRYVLCAVDWCVLSNSSHLLLRRKMATAADTHVSHVAVQCVHQHTAPVIDSNAQKLLEQVETPPPFTDLKFLEEVTDRLAAAVKKSVGRLRPFDSVGTGQAKVDRVASSKWVPGKSGKMRMRWSCCKDPKLRAAPEGYIDPFLKTITLAHDGKSLVRLHYYATHPQSFYGDGRASYDVPGIARERLERKENVFQIYFTGCGCDIAMGKYNDGSRRARKELGDRLYAGMEAAIASTRFTPVSRIHWRTVPLLLPPKTDGRYNVAKNRVIMENPEADATSRVFAARRIACVKRLKRPIELSSLQVGRVHILHLPGEPMVEFQLFAQQLMPDDFVAVAGYGEGAPSNICTERACAEVEDGRGEPIVSMVLPRSEVLLKAAIRELLRVE